MCEVRINVCFEQATGGDQLQSAKSGLSLCAAAGQKRPLVAFSWGSSVGAQPELMQAGLLDLPA